MSSANSHPENTPSFKAALSPATRKALMEFWGNDEIINKPEIIADLGPDGVSRINRIGKKSLGEIARALECFHHTDSSHQWLAMQK